MTMTLNEFKNSLSKRELIKGFYIISDYHAGTMYLAHAESSEIALEMSQYVFGENGAVENAYSDIMQIVNAAVTLFNNAGVNQGYISSGNVVVEFKTRKQIIDDVLNIL